MNYEFDYLSRAVKQISDNGKKNLAEYENKLNGLYKAVPELERIEATLSKIGAAAAVAAVSGEAEKISELSALSADLQQKKQEILSSANITPPKYGCDLCNDSGVLPDGSYCACTKAKAAEMQLAELSKYTPIAFSTFSNFDLKYYPEKSEDGKINPRKNMTGIFKMAKEYAINFSTSSPSILFMGGVGLGKTHLTLAMVREIILKGHTVIYGAAQNIFNDIEREHFSYSGSSVVFDALLSADLLVIDDLGTEFATSFTQSAFYNIVNTRILKGLPTIINTNLSFKEIEERYTPRISSRFIGSYEMIKFFGNDIRMQKKLQKA